MRKLLLIQRYAILTLLGLIAIFAIPLSLSIIFETEVLDNSNFRHPASTESDPPMGTVYIDNFKDEGQKTPAGDVAWPLPVKSIDCGPTQDLGSIDGDMIRLKAWECEEGLPTRFTNTTNGYTSDAISVRKGEFSSDYVDLKIGSNKIQVVRTDKTGVKTTQTLTIERRLRAASADNN